MDEYVFLRSTGHRFQDLYLCFCGYEECRPLHRWGPCVRPNYLIHYILSGKGTFQVGDRTWELREGDGFLIEPEVATFYQADATEPWTYVWISFDGRIAGELLGNLGLGGDHLTFHCEKKLQLKQVVLTMLKNDRFSVSNDYLLESQLFLFFTILLEGIELDTSPPGVTVPRHSSSYVRIAQEYIRNNYARPSVKVQDIASYVGLNRSYLYTLFQKEAGMSPLEYLTTFRLSRAEELLNSTDLSIESIAISSGYADPVVFSKAFKRYRGMTPQQHRKEWKEGTARNRMDNRERLEGLSGEESGENKTPSGRTPRRPEEEKA